MTPGKPDLTSCDTEPIHEIGSVQPYGALLAVDASSLVVSHASENLGKYLDLETTEALGQPLADIIGEAACQDLLQCQLEPRAPHLLRPWFFSPPSGSGNLQRIECLPHKHGGKIIIEMLQMDEGHADVWQQDLLRQNIISQLMNTDSLAGLSTVSASLIREVTGFDRVMIYRFAEDGHGEVIAEATDRADSFMGLHYPASDIPEPARRHFTLNLIRAISDINAVPSPILTGDGEKADTTSGQPLDLTYSKLRAVAPVHIEYLNNMGVGASMSISLVSNDELWGLVACHHYSPHHLSSSVLRFCEMLGGTVSTLLQNLQNTELLRHSIMAERTAFDLEMTARANPDLHEVVTGYAENLMKMVDASGMIFNVAGKRLRFGTVPGGGLDFNALSSDLQDGVAVTSHLSSLTNLTSEQVKFASGAAYLELSEDGEDYLVFLREQYEHAISWAGKPEKVEVIGEDGVERLSPRGSFALWRQERLGRSKPFSPIDREVLRIMRRALFALNSLNRERAAVTAQKQAEASQARLRMTLMEAARKSSMGELAGALAHEVNQPLAAVTNYVNACRQELYNYQVDVPDSINELINLAVDEASRAADLVRRLRNFISTGELIKEQSDLNLVIVQAAEFGVVADDGGSAIALENRLDNSLKPVLIDPVQVGQVVLNLVRNSVEAMRGEQGTITLTSSRDGNMVVVSVADTGPGVPPEESEMLFEPFHSSTTSGMGIGLSLCRSIVEAHDGKIWLEPGTVGADVRFSLPAT